MNYGKLNKETISVKNPIPRLQYSFRVLEGAKCFSAVDIAQGYFKIPIIK